MILVEIIYCTNVLLVVQMMVPVISSQNLTLPPLTADDLTGIISFNTSGLGLGSSLHMAATDSASFFSPDDYTPNFFSEGT